MQGVGGAYPDDCLNVTKEPARKRAKNFSDAPNSLPVQMNECQRQSEDVLRDLQMHGDVVTSVNLSVSYCRWNLIQSYLMTGQWRTPRCVSLQIPNLARTLM